MNAPVQTPADVSDMAAALRVALLRLNRQLRREADQVGLSSLDATLLAMVAKNPGIGVSELADKERTSRPTMSTHVKRLEAAGHLARQAPSADDRRRVGLLISPEGVKALELLRRRRTDWLADRLQALTPQEREAISRALEPLTAIAANAR